VTGNLVGAATGRSSLKENLVVMRVEEREAVEIVGADVVALLGTRELELTHEVRSRYLGW
jgi:hypothetical protein